MKIKGLISNTAKDKTSTFFINSLSKVLAISITFSNNNLLFFDSMADVYVCNNQSMFSEFLRDQLHYQV